MLKINELSTRSPVSVYDSSAYGRTVAFEEGGTWIVVEDSEGDWRLPLILRPIPKTSRIDAVTPYGYGGLHTSEHLDENEINNLWRESNRMLAKEGVVSIFLRFPPFLPRQAERAQLLENLSVHDVSKTIVVPTGNSEEMWANMHSRSRTAVRAAQKAGCRAEVVEANDILIAKVRELYEQTMHRVGASENYFFSDDYYENLATLGNRLHIARVLDSAGKCVSASFILTDARFAHYHLSGSTGTVSGANNFLLWAVMEWATGEGLELVHLGGGVSDGDSLYKFKSSFGGHAAPFSIGKCILLEDVYTELSEQHAQAVGVPIDQLNSQNFFPTYRFIGK